MSITDPVTVTEQVVLGAIISRGLSAEEVFTSYPPTSFHGANFTAAEVIAKVEHPSPSTVLAQATRDGVLGRLANGAYIHTLVAMSTDNVYTPAHLDFLAANRWRTRLGEVAVRIGQLAEDSSRDPEWVQQQAELLVGAAPLNRPLDDVDANFSDFLDQPEEETRWVVPDLLAHRERFLLTGPEGYGKSTLVRQIAMAVACGLHPFRQTAIPTKRVWFLDLENDPAETRRALRRVYNRWTLPLASHEIQMRLDFMPRGLNVASPTDARWLRRQADAFRPDLVVLTPLYKLHRVAITEELAARDVVDALDDLRERSGAALVIEAHSPLATDGGPTRVLRPYGSSVFLRWPEFGRGLRMQPESTPEHRLATLESWRGDRYVRLWPERLCSGDPLPWIEDPR